MTWQTAKSRAAALVAALLPKIAAFMRIARLSLRKILFCIAENKTPRMVYLVGSKPGANGADKANHQNLTAMTYSKAYLKRTNQRVIRHEITGEKMLDVANKNKAKRAARVYPLKSKKGRRDVFAEIFA